jgi:probable HAF family extracellular repeat protein
MRRGLEALLAAAVALAALAALVSGAGAATSPYTAIDLGTLGGDFSRAVAINDDGQVVGDARTAGGARPAFSWTQTGGMVDLGTLGGDSSFATEINDSKQIVGTSTTESGATHAFFWTQAGGMIDLGTLGGDTSFPNAVNHLGQVVGVSETATDFVFHAFSWTQAGGMIDLTPNSSTTPSTTFAVAVNDAGQVAGTDERHAFLWTQTGGLVDLGTLGGSGSRAFDLNEQGQIAGDSLTATSADRAFLWTQAGGMINLGTLGGGPGLPETESQATSLNDSGQVVGTTGVSGPIDVCGPRAFSWTQSGGMIEIHGLDCATRPSALNEHGQVVGESNCFFGLCASRAFSWTQTGGTIDLGGLGGDGSIAYAVNNLGQVVGQSATAGGPTHAVLWQPGPTTIDQCMKGGWRNFGQFKNQGDCVSFVATGGKHAPS